MELARLIIWYGETYNWLRPFYLELSLIGLGFVGQVWVLVLLIKRWRQ